MMCSLFRLPNVVNNRNNLKNYIDDAYENWENPPVHVTIVGDAMGAMIYQHGLKAGVDTMVKEIIPIQHWKVTMYFQKYSLGACLFLQAVI